MGDGKLGENYITSAHVPPFGHKARRTQKGYDLARFNRNFELTLHDIDMIEYALQKEKTSLSLDRMAMMAGGAPNDDNYKSLEEIEEALIRSDDLLGRLHNQKTFYRPKDSKKAPYISG